MHNERVKAITGLAFEGAAKTGSLYSPSDLHRNSEANFSSGSEPKQIPRMWNTLSVVRGGVRGT